MRAAAKLVPGVLALAAGSVAALAQSAVISARSGLIHYVEGQVYVDGQLVETKFGVFPEVKENQQLKTEEGRAEVLLTPGVFLRLGENSSFRMITNRLIDTRLEFQSGSAVVEVADVVKDNSVTVAYKDAAVHPVKRGVYRFDAAAGELHVYDGSAEVAAAGQTVEVKEGHVVALDTLAVHKFDKTSTDALNRWSERRAGYVSMANVGAAATVNATLFTSGGGLGMFTGGWYWNPFLGMYSYVPGMGGMFYGPYGCPMFSPIDVYMAFDPYSNYPCYTGYRNYPGYMSAYNTVNYKSLPVPRRPIYHPLSGGSFHEASGGYAGRPASSSVASSSVSSSTAVSHGSGAVGGGTGGASHH
ncbi:MAG: hypothetical protein ABSF64_02190 [Bryobacteraceae bacterium]|jgi:hypothetical protein